MFYRIATVFLISAACVDATFAAEPTATVTAPRPVVAPTPPMSRASASPQAVKDSTDSIAAIFARRDLARLRPLAKPFRDNIAAAAAPAAAAQKKLAAAKAAQTAAGKAIAAADAALKQATATKVAAEKSATAAKKALDEAAQKVEAAKKQVDAAQQDEAKQKAAAEFAALQTALTTAQQTHNEAVAVVVDSEKQIQAAVAAKKLATTKLATANNDVKSAAAAAKSTAATQAKVEKEARPMLARLAAAEERAALYASATATADPKLTRLVATHKHDRPILSCRISIDGEHIFFGAQDNQLHRKDLVTGAAANLEGHRSWIRRFAFHPDGKRLLSGAYEGRLIWWNSSDDKPTPQKDVDAHKGFVRAVAVSPDGQFVATGGNDNFVRVWSADDGKLIAELPGHARHVYNIAFHPSGSHLVSGDLMGVLKKWEVGSWKHVSDLDCSVLTKYDKTFRADCGGIRGMDFSPDGSQLVVCGISKVTNAFAGIGTPTAVLFDWESNKRLNVFTPTGKFQGTCWGVRFHPSGEFLVGAGSANGLWFWKPGNDKSFFDYKLPSVAYDLTFHPDNLRLAIALYDKTIRIYNLGPKTETEKKADAAKKAKTKKKK